MFALAIVAMPSHAQTLSWEGVGPIKLGMTAEEAERALGTKLGPVELPFSKQCYVTWRADGRDQALYYVIVDGRIAVIGLYRHDEAVPLPDVVDANGIGVGATEADIGRAYGQTERTFAPYESEETKEEIAERIKQGVMEPPPPPHYRVIAKSPDAGRAIIFETLDCKVTDWRTGILPDVLAWEDCI